MPSWYITIVQYQNILEGSWMEDKEIKRVFKICGEYITSHLLSLMFKTYAQTWTFKFNFVIILELHLYSSIEPPMLCIQVYIYCNLHCN